MLAVFPVWMSVEKGLENSSMGAGGIWGDAWGVGMIYGVACGELGRYMRGIWGVGVAFVYGNGVDIDLGADNSKASSN